MATGRRKKKTATRKKRKAAPAAKKKKARKAKPKARAKAAKRKPKPKPKAKARKVAKKKPRATARGGILRLRRSAPAPRPEPERTPEAVPFAAPQRPTVDPMQGNVEHQLRAQGYEPPDETVVAVLAAIGRGYAQGPAAAPEWLHIDTAGPVAEGVVERFVTGDRSSDINRITHRAQVRATVGFNLEQLGGGDTGESEREVLTAFCLGSWDPDTHTNAQRDGVASFVVPWYLAGR